MTAAAGAPPAGRWRLALATARVVAAGAYRSYRANRGLESAATLAYYGFFALMPLLLLLIFALSLVLRSSATAFASLGAAIHKVYPTFSDPILTDLLALTRGRAWGVVSILLLVWSTTPLTGGIRSTLEHIFRVEHRRSLWRSKAIDLAAAITLLGIFVAVVAGTMLASAARASLADAGSPLVTLVGVVSAWAGLAGMLFLVYRVFGGAQLRWRHLVAGALVAAALLAVARPLFQLVLRFNPDYGYVFGSLKAVFLVLLWTYATFAVLLFGAEVAAALNRKEALLLRGALAAPRPAEWKAPRILVERFIRAFSGGTILFHEGDGGHEMYYVLEGEVALEKEGRQLRCMGPGDYFGEMSMLLDLPRTATARVVSPEANLLSIPRENFDLILRENPEIVQRMLREMAGRLKATSEQVAPAEPARDED